MDVGSGCSDVRTQALLEIRKIKEKRAHGKPAPTLAQKFYLELSGVSTDSLTKHQAFMMVARLKQEEGMHKHHA